jgi:hypothetical protein
VGCLGVLGCQCWGCGWGGGSMMAHAVPLAPWRWLTAGPRLANLSGQRGLGASRPDCQPGLPGPPRGWPTCISKHGSSVHQHQWRRRRRRRRQQLEARWSGQCPLQRWHLWLVARACILSCGSAVRHCCSLHCCCLPHNPSWSWSCWSAAGRQWHLRCSFPASACVAVRGGPPATAQQPRRRSRHEAALDRAAAAAAGVGQRLLWQGWTRGP